MNSHTIMRTCEMSQVDREIMGLIYAKVQHHTTDQEWHEYKGVIIYKYNPLKVEITYRFVNIGGRLHLQLQKFKHEEDQGKIIKPKFIHHSKGEH